METTTKADFETVFQAMDALNLECSRRVTASWLRGLKTLGIRGVTAQALGAPNSPSSARHAWDRATVLRALGWTPEAYNEALEAQTRSLLSSCG